jgi:hypothetical protein
MILTNSVRTSQETHYVSAIEINPLMLFRETVAVYCENHTEHADTLYGQNAECILFFVLYSAVLSVSKTMAWNGKVLNIELERIWKDAVVA